MKWVVGLLSLTALVYLFVGFSSSKSTVQKEDSAVTALIVAVNHIDAARELILEGKFDEALAEIDNALKADPDNEQAIEVHEKLTKLVGAPGSPFRVAFALRRAGKFDEALSELERAVKADPDNKMLVALYESHKEHLKADGLKPEDESEKAERQATFDEEREYHSSRLEKDPRSAKKHFEYAEYLLGKALYGEADKELQEVLKLQPDYPRADLLKNGINKVAEEGEPIFRELTASMESSKVSSLSDDLSDLSLKLKIIPLPGETLQETERNVEANVERERQKLQAQYQGFDRYEGGSEEVSRSFLILRYSWDQDWEGAARQYERLSNVYPESPLPSSNYADALLRANRLDDASNVLKRARERFPRDVALAVIADLLKEVREGARPPDAVSSELGYRLSLVTSR